MVIQEVFRFCEVSILYFCFFFKVGNLFEREREMEVLISQENLVRIFSLEVFYQVFFMGLGRLKYSFEWLVVGLFLCSERIKIGVLSIQRVRGDILCVYGCKGMFGVFVFVFRFRSWLGFSIEYFEGFGYGFRLYGLGLWSRIEVGQ